MKRSLVVLKITKNFCSFFRYQDIKIRGRRAEYFDIQFTSIAAVVSTSNTTIYIYFARY